MLELIKQTHITCALATGMLFIVRGFWMIVGSKKLDRPVVRIAPHVIDTVLLVSAVVMLFGYQLNPLQHPWILAKLVAVLLYIACGMIAFRFGKTRLQKIVFWLAAMLVLASIYGFAFTKRVIFW